MQFNNTWNTWDVRCLNAVMKIPDMAEIRIGIYDDKIKYLQDEMLWRNVQREGSEKEVEQFKNVLRFGVHHPLGKYFDIDLKYWDFIFNTEFASNEDVFVYKITPRQGRENIKFYISGLFRWNPVGSIRKEPEELIFETPKGCYHITFEGEQNNSLPVNAVHQGFLFESSRPVYIRCNCNYSIDEMEEFLQTNKNECIDEMVSGGGMLKDSPEAIIKGVAWNSIYEPVKDRLCTPVARTWCTANGEGFGSYVLFDWDTFFAGILSGIQDKTLAYQQIYSVLEEVTEEGFVPNFGAQRGASYDRSQPPVGAYCVLKLYSQYQEKKLLEDTYERLKTWNKWWIPNRDGNMDGLLEWGSNPYPIGEELGYEANNMQGAMYESGLDNSPMYDDVVYNKETHTMELADVGLNSMYTLDLWALSKIAEILGKETDALLFEREYLIMKDKINVELWNEEMGIYCNKHWDGRFSTVLSPTNFYPLLAGICSKYQAERVINEHLLNENEFWGEYVIPSVSKNCKAFWDNDYWRGRIWGPMNFMVHEGLKRSGFYEESYKFAVRSLNLFQKEWTEENHIHENYNCITGDGDDKRNADPVYTWGGLLAYTAISEVIDVEPWSGIRAGNLSEEYAEIKNYRICNDTYSVRTGINLIIQKNGIDFIKSDIPVCITGLITINETLMINIKSRVNGKVSINVEEGISRICADINGVQQEFSVMENCKNIMIKVG